MNRNLLLVAISMMTWGIGEGMFLLFQPIYLEELGADPVMIGGILGTIGFAMTISYLPAGYLADRFGRRPLLLAAWIMGTSAAWVMALAKTLPLFVIGSIWYGLTTFVMVPLNSYITAARGNWSVGRALTLISAIFNIGAIIGPLLGGLIGDRFGLRTNYMIAASVFTLSSSIIVFISPQPIAPPTPGAKQARYTGLLNRAYLQYLLVIFIAMFCMYLPQPLSQNFLQNERGVTLAQIGILISARSVGIVVLNLVLGQLNSHIGFLLAQVAMALFTLLVWLGGGFYNYVLAYLLIGGYQTARLLATARGQTLLTDATMGVGYGMIETAMATAMVLAPPLAGLLYAQNPSWVYLISLILITLAFVLTSLFSPLRTSNLTKGDKEELEWTGS